MNSYKVLYLVSLVSILIFGVTFFLSQDKKEDKESSIYAALRNSGHELLLENKDSTSLILPIKKLNKKEFQLSFQKELSILPDHLVSSIEKNLKATNLTPNYTVEVHQCASEEIVYSYQIREQIENTIVPCKGRELPSNCYLVKIHFMNSENKVSSISNGSLITSFIFLLLGFIVHYRKKTNSAQDSETANNFIAIGNYKFYKDQNKLVKEKIVIDLSSKECELIEIFSENQNQIVRRETLIKKVWEDNGVIVGRSLDTYISKIRKKLKEDDSIKIVNIHGVGYKLESNQHNSNS